ncbi:AraC family transcriptional regulator [Xanthomonas phaseoli pv. phaseoli]|uniref:AraC family transcriptional regulator n=1 Tax=Xanthomonas phaseoli TaxID=1985254 RepID=UPI0005963BA8|nr:AraC family transcriptional regulator [Xanthomonas phaseoli]KIJ01537.1 AraC family transcriptional regulator [Xanthomonas phaseoli pv. phaseoli]QWN28108.1 AraC family transcriptional regulator [Xanthomonas phaseoli pv. phaseoli]UZB27781.1 AraC family transcriptional regulator [Xanthomonas phaseoli pv. phaseoli]
MSLASLEQYRSRMRRALDHIDQHLDQDLDLQAVSEVAAFSKFHFHRQFMAVFGLSMHRYVQLVRMKRASYQLAYRDAQTVTDIAMGAGYETPEAFARAFRKRLGQSPSSFRKSPDWEPWFWAFEPLSNARRILVSNTFSDTDVTIRTVPSTRVAIMTHQGDRAMLGATLQRFIAWRKAAGLHPRHSPTFNVWHPADPAAYRVDLCAGTDRPVEPHSEQIRVGEIPGGRCAVLRVVGYTDNLEPAALYLYRDWLPASGEELRDFPLYCQRLAFFPEVPEHETVAELFLPLK